MPEPAPDLLDAAQAVEIASSTAFKLWGAPYTLPAGQIPSPPLVAVLQQALYAFYCRGPAAVPQTRPTDLAAARRFTAALSQANDGRGTREPGWKVVEIDDDGRVVVAKDGISLWAAPGDFEPQGGVLRAGYGAEPGPAGRSPIVKPGVRGRLRIGKELRGLSPGFYFALGNGTAPDEDDPALPLVRYYWHVTAAGAAPLVGAICSALNGVDVPFRLKVASDPQGYRRADAAVLYLGGEAQRRAAEVLAAVYPAVAPRLRAEVPRFTRRLAPGVGVAEDPRVEGLSFGQHRCQVVAEGLWTAFTKQRLSTADRADEVAAAFVRHGLDPAQPHLGAGSDRDYPSIAPGGAS